MKWFNQKRYFKALNVPSGPTPSPVVGNLFQIVRKGLIEFDKELINKYGKDKKIVGYFEGSTPFILCADPEMIKQIAIKDFCNFINRRVILINIHNTNKNMPIESF